MLNFKWALCRHHPFPENLRRDIRIHVAAGSPEHAEIYYTYQP